jgi:transcriptional regulator with XRE-family HTH domain
MREFGFTQESLSKAMGINECTLNGKLNGKGFFSTKEIDKIAELLQISNDEIGVYFFSPKSLEK